MKDILVQFVLLTMLFTTKIHGQNLVVNGNFEQYTTCVSQPGLLMFCKGWRPYHSGSADYYNACNVQDTTMGIPGNFMGRQEAANGKAYAGVLCRATEAFEYMAGTMKAMTKGHTYKVSMYVSMADKGKYAINGFGIWFYEKGATETVLTMDNKTIPATPQIRFPDTITEKNGWVRLSTSFIADSAYKNIVIGNFLQQQDTVATFPGPAFPTYYYFDSVVVEEDLSVSIKTQQSDNIVIYPNPVANELAIDGINTGTDIRVLDMMGRVLISTMAITTTERINTSALPAGTYILQLRYDGEAMNRRIQKE